MNATSQPTLPSLILKTSIAHTLTYFRVFKHCRDSVHGKDGFHGISRKELKNPGFVFECP